MIRGLTLSAELKELQKITRILTLAHSESLEREISKYASTDRRKMIWVLIDGINMPSDIMNKIRTTKVGKRTVYDFLEVLEKAKLIENPEGKPPRRLIDLVPASWIDLLEEKTEEKKKTQKPKKPKPANQSATKGAE